MAPRKQHTLVGPPLSPVWSIVPAGSRFPSALGHPQGRRCPKRLYPAKGRGSGVADGDGVLTFLFYF